MTARHEQLLESLLDCDGPRARSVIEAALADAVTPERLFSEVIHPAFEAMGELWEGGEVALTQQFVAARAVEDAAQALARGMVGQQAGWPKVVLGGLTEGHVLGARLVAIFLRAAGMEVVDAGRGLEPEVLVARAVAERADVLAVSAFMLRDAGRIGEVRRIRDRVAPQVKLVVGGAPFRAYPGLAQHVGADGWAPDAVRAVDMIRAVAAAGSGPPPAESRGGEA